MIFLYIFIAIVFLLFIVIALLPSKVHVERTMMIEAPINKVFDQVNDLKNWKNWSAWHKMDPEQKTEFSENTSGQGAWQTWESENKNVGNGKMTISDTQINKRIVLDLEFEKWGNNTSYYDFEEVDEQIKMTMWMDNDFKGFTKLFGSMMKKNLTKQFDTSLVGIKEICEEKG